MVPQDIVIMRLLGGTGLVHRLPTGVMMDILLYHLAQEEELASQMELGMDILKIAIVNIFQISFLFTVSYYKKLNTCLLPTKMEKISRYDCIKLLKFDH